MFHTPQGEKESIMLAISYEEKDILAIGASALVDSTKLKVLKTSFRRGEENVQ